LLAAGSLANRPGGPPKLYAEAEAGHYVPATSAPARRSDTTSRQSG